MPKPRVNVFLWEMDTYGEEGKFKSLEKPFRTFKRNLNFYIMHCHSILPPSIIKLKLESLKETN